MDPFIERLTAALAPAYSLGPELSGAGMSRVFVATERALGRKVVVKVLPPDLAAGVNRDRFRREIQLAANLQHPHIVPLLAAGEDGELLYYTMPFIEGESLKVRLQRDGRLPVRAVLRILHDVVDALVYAHHRGVIHRDIKPGNILTHGQHALVTDFGVAKALSAALPTSAGTSSGMAIGTPAYMAPEQLAADPAADHRVDLYALGLLTYELLTGRSPFEGLSPTATMAAQLTRDPEPLAPQRPDAPAALTRLVDRCLAKLPEDRPPTAAALLADLELIPIPSGSTPAGTPATPRGRRVAAGVALVAVAGLATSLVITRWGPEAVPADSANGGGAGAGAPAEVAVLSREDSLAIARALRDQLAEKKEPAAGAPSPKTTVFSEVQVDSIVRASFEEAASRARAFRWESAGGPLVVRLQPGEPVTSVQAPAGPPLPVNVVAPQRHTDPRLAALSQGLAEELRGRLEAGGIEVAAAGEGRSSPVTVSLDLVALPGDSAIVLVKVRNLAAEPGFSYRVSSSAPAPADRGALPHQRALDEAVGQVREVLAAPRRFRATRPPGESRPGP